MSLAWQYVILFLSPWIFCSCLAALCYAIEPKR